MPNGRNLHGSSSSTQSSVLVPMPGNPSRTMYLAVVLQDLDFLIRWW